MPIADGEQADRLRQRLYRELGLSPFGSGDPAGEWSEREWALLHRAVDLALAKMRTELEVGMHVKRMLPCDAIVHAGILPPDQLRNSIAAGQFDGQLCALPLPEL